MDTEDFSWRIFKNFEGPFRDFEESKFQIPKSLKPLLKKFFWAAFGRRL